VQLNPYAQAVAVLKRATTVLIVLPEDPSADAVAAGLGLYLALGKLKKEAQVVSLGFELHPRHRFLPRSEAIRGQLTNLRPFVITVKTSGVQLADLSYELEADRLRIFLTPKDGTFDPKAVSAASGGYPYDAVVTIDAPDLEALGAIATENAEFFYHTPLINIDHHASNTGYGQVNLLDVVATSTSEIVFELLRAAGFETFDEAVATNLLAGMLSKTKGFQAPTVTPRSLAVASHLIAAGARRDDIIRNLFQTKKLSTLNLWGRVLARLKETAEGCVVWSVVGPVDFEKSGAATNELPGVIDELIVNAPTAELVAVLNEQPGAVELTLASTKPRDLRAELPDWKLTGEPTFARATFEGKRAVDIERTIVDRLAALLPK
jgi:nanoRNase/pAp phosphatase (c-di-AMP/oligoRNAs hydrolase)